MLFLLSQKPYKWNKYNGQILKAFSKHCYTIVIWDFFLNKINAWGSHYMHYLFRFFHYLSMKMILRMYCIYPQALIFRGSPFLRTVFPICTLWWVGKYWSCKLHSLCIFFPRSCANWGVGWWVSPNLHIVQIRKPICKNGPSLMLNGDSSYGLTNHASFTRICMVYFYY